MVRLHLIATTPADRFLGPDPISEALTKASPPGQEWPRIRAVDTLYDDLRAVRHGFAKANINDSFQIQHAADLYQLLYFLFDPDRGDRGTQWMRPSPGSGTRSASRCWIGWVYP